MTEQVAEERAYAKVTARLLPFLFVCYLAAYLDRVNVGFAKLQMLGDLGLSESMYGLGAGIFFVGYFFFEVPSNILLHRVGARRWIARIMITWGLLSSLTMFVRTPGVFYATRFLLGVLEAGFFPGIILYLTYWYPAARRARMTALFMTAVPVTGVLGGPLSGLVMTSLAGKNGWAGWQWLFLVEGIPSIVLGALTLVRLDDGPREARWLTADEKALLAAALEKEDRARAHLPLRLLFRSGRLWLLCLVYFLLVMGLYGVSFWLPTLIKATGVADPFRVGLLTAIPYGAATISMLTVARSADLTGERRWHVAVPALVGAAGFGATALWGTTTATAVLTLTFATLGALAALPSFWSLPTSFLGGAAAAAGIALVNSIGNLAGFVSPYLFGLIKERTQGTAASVAVLALSLSLAAAVVLGGIPAERR